MLPFPRRSLLRLTITGMALIGLCLPGKAGEKRLYPFSHFRLLPVVGATGKAYPKQQQAKDVKPPTAVPSKRTIRSDVPLDVQARETAERAIPYVEKKGLAWIKDRKCLSCHYSGYMLWSLRDASQRGFAIDKDKLVESTNWALNQQKDYGVEGTAQMLIARDRADRSEQTLKLIERLQDEIIKGQDKNGFWKPGGQLPDQKRPVSETTQVSTMLCILALDSLDKLSDKGIESRDKGVAWLKKTPPNGKNPAVSSEWYAAKLLIEKKFGDPKEVDSLRNKILSAQQPDGGWGWLWADRSDAFGTGLSVYALSQAGIPNSQPVIQKAWRFLIETQTEDGSWIVNGTKNATKAQPHPFSSYWGSTWALLGLSHSLPITNPK